MPTCNYCGDPATTLDHIIARIHFVDWPDLGDYCGLSGPHDPNNLAPACRSCNGSKGVRLIEEWLMACVLSCATEWIGESAQRNKVGSAIYNGRCALWVSDMAAAVVARTTAGLLDWAASEVSA